MRRVATSITLCVGAMACHRGRPGGASVPCNASGPPAIAAVRPDSTPSNGDVQLELTGCRFDPARNDVLIGAFTVRGVSANADGTRLRVTLPQFRPPGADAPPAPLPPGTYSVIVRNQFGTSAPSRLTLTFRP